MFRKALMGAVALLAGSAVVASAGPKEDLQAAVKKLADGGNYTWKTTTETANQGGFTPGPVEGKTQKDGLTMVSTSFNDQTSITVRQGDKGAVKRGDQDWMSFAEMQAGGGGGGGRGRGFGGGAGGVNPAAQFEQQIAGLTDVKKDGDVYSSTVTGDAVSAFMPFGRGGRGRGGAGGGGGAGGAGGAGGGPQITNGKVAVKFTVKDGVVSKYEMVLQGSMSFNGNDIDLGRTTTTQISNIGTTKVEIPAEAKAKLAQ
jgi:hypothetical protein